VGSSCALTDCPVLPVTGCLCILCTAQVCAQAIVLQYCSRICWTCRKASLASGHLHSILHMSAGVMVPALRQSVTLSQVGRMHCMSAACIADHLHHEHIVTYKWLAGLIVSSSHPVNERCHIALCMQLWLLSAVSAGASSCSLPSLPHMLCTCCW
jgi:hypothetical protein